MMCKIRFRFRGNVHGSVGSRSVTNGLTPEWTANPKIRTSVYESMHILELNLLAMYTFLVHVLEKCARARPSESTGDSTELAYRLPASDPRR